jgi:plastocyanin
MLAVKALSTMPEPHPIGRNDLELALDERSRPHSHGTVLERGRPSRGTPILHAVRARNLAEDCLAYGLHLDPEVTPMEPGMTSSDFIRPVQSRKERPSRFGTLTARTLALGLVHRSRPMKHLSLIAVLLLTLAACGGGTSVTSAPADDGGNGGADAETVSLAGQRFSPAELTIPAGTSVTFTDTAGHTVTEGTDGEPLDDPIVDEGGGADIVVTFEEAGTYNITCTIHSTMNMTITVEG